MSTGFGGNLNNSLTTILIFIKLLSGVFGLYIAKNVQRVDRLFLSLLLIDIGDR